MRQKYVVGNWKMNPANKEEAVSLARDIDHALDNLADVQAVICPPHVYLAPVRLDLKNLALGAQDVSPFAAGAYTGQVSAAQLYNLGVTYCLAGHSERIRHARETAQDINGKIKACREKGIRPVVCLGAGLSPQDPEAKIRAVVRRQFTEYLSDISLDKIILAYEPTWAISGVGGGRMPTPNHVQAMAEFIKSLAAPEHFKEVAVLYGGNVNAHDAQEFNVCDGFLVGAASLNANDFIQIVQSL